MPLRPPGHSEEPQEPKPAARKSAAKKQQPTQPAPQKSVAKKQQPVEAAPQKSAAKKQQPTKAAPRKSAAKKQQPPQPAPRKSAADVPQSRTPAPTTDPKPVALPDPTYRGIRHWYESPEHVAVAPAPATPPTPQRPPPVPAGQLLKQRLAKNLPPNYPTTFNWFWAGLRRQPAGTAVALLSSYTALFVALWYAVLGMILGILVAVRWVNANSFTRGLFHAGAGTSVTLVAVVTGALGGAGGAFVNFYTRTLVQNPYGIVVALAVGFLTSVVMVALVAVFEGNLLGFRGYRPLTTAEVHRVSPLLQQLGTDYNLQYAPRFAMQETPVVNAWTHMRHIVLTTGLLDTLDDNQLAAVIAHELHHWRSGDAVGVSIVWASAWPIVLLYNLASAITRSTQQEAEAPPRRVGGFLFFIAWAIAWPAGLLIKFPITLAITRDMRKYEFEADAAVRAIGRGPGLISALNVLKMFEGGRSGWESALYATHPSARERIDRLARTPGDQDYREAPLGAETKGILELFGAIALVFVALIAWGAAINASRASHSVASAGPAGASGNSGSRTTTTQPVLPTSAVRAVEHTAASFATAMIDNAYNQPGYTQIVAEYVPADQQPSLDAQASNYSGSLYGTDPARINSRATVLACELDPVSTSSNPTVDIFVRWTSGVDGRTTDQWFTDRIPLALSGGRWVPTDVPHDLPGVAGLYGEPQSQYLNSAIPSGYASCS